MNCYRHPNEETFLRCGKCDRPICPRCTKHGPAGARCPECASLNSSTLFQVSSGQMLAGGVVGFAASFALGYLLGLGESFGFFLLWGALLAGGGLGEAVMRATGRKRGVKMEVLTGASVTLGAIASGALWYSRVVQPQLAAAGGTIELALQFHVYYLLALLIMIFSAVSRVRFL